MNEEGKPMPIEDLLADLPAGWEELANDRISGMLGVSVVNWRTLGDGEAASVWTKLGDWVDWFTRRYEIAQRKIPACWYQHAALVEELSALHAAWLVSYDTTDAGYGPIGWHERLNEALNRISTWYNGECRDGHNPSQQRPKAASASDTNWDAWIRTAH